MKSKQLEGYEKYFHEAPLDVPEFIDPSFLDRNLVPEVTIRSFRVESPKPIPIAEFETPPLKVLSGLGIDAYFAALNAPSISLTEQNFDQLPKERSDRIAKAESTTGGGLVDPDFFEANGFLPNSTPDFYRNVAEIAWSGQVGPGFIQATKLAHQRYGVMPSAVKGTLPNTGQKKERQMAYTPNINFVLVVPEEAEALSQMYKDIGAKHDYDPNSDRPWFSAHENDNIYIVLYLETTSDATEEQQRTFLSKVFGNELTPEREDRIRADGGYSGILTYALLKLGIEAAHRSLHEYKDNRKTTILEKRSLHFDVDELNSIAIDRSLHAVAVGFLNFLGQRNDGNKS